MTNDNRFFLTAILKKKIAYNNFCFKHGENYKASIFNRINIEYSLKCF